MGDTTCAHCVYETLDAIWEVLAPEYMPAPTEDMWITSERGFSERWNFPNCVAAVDGKHVALQCPNGLGSTYRNYKGTFSTVLLALVDAFYRFR